MKNGYGKKMREGMEKQKNILLLWDIDGTLMSCRDDGTKALNELFRRWTGVERALGEIKVGTAMDSAILGSLMERFRIPFEEKERMITEFAEILKDILDRNETKRALPGIKEILATLTEQENVYMGILTSNFKIGADLKLDSVGLKDYFSFGGYGDIEGEKWHAAKLAVETAEKKAGEPFAKESIYLIGDTCYDIRCARKLGVRSIAVATGWTDQETLREAQPDYFFADLSDPQAFYDIIDLNN